MNKSNDVLVVPLIAAVALVSAKGTEAAQPNTQQFLTAASCPDCAVHAVTKLTLPQSGVEAYSAKLVHSSQRVHKVITLLGDGATIADPAVLRRMEKDAYRARFGKLSRRLYGQSRSVPANTPLAVAIWTNARITYPAKEELLSSQAKLNAHLNLTSTELRRKAAPILSAIAAAGGTSDRGRKHEPPDQSNG